MTKTHPLKIIAKARSDGSPKGICSICSANSYVIEAVMERALTFQGFVLIEATANQVNQFGGYTGMRPADFKEFVLSIARKVNFPEDKIILGGDHLGPLTWKNEDAEEAMKKAAELVRQYVLAGFTKIHIDTSMNLGDDLMSGKKLDTETIAERSCMLFEAADEAYRELKRVNPDALEPVYVIGSEVPTPGGSQAENEVIQVTKAEDFEEMMHIFKNALKKHRLERVWESIIAVVVQLGVEFGDEEIHEYSRDKTEKLCKALNKFPGIVFEGHSTDYQTPENLKKMVEDGVAVLKVGPALTFALREALFALYHMENELFKYRPEIRLSNFINTLDTAMVKNPEHWRKHYHGSPEKISYARKYSLSDRARYYLALPEVKESISLLIGNLKSIDIPRTLISQYMPIQYKKLRAGLIENDPECLIKDRIADCYEDYLNATGILK